MKRTHDAQVDFVKKILLLKGKCYLFSTWDEYSTYARRRWLLKTIRRMRILTGINKYIYKQRK